MTATCASYIHEYSMFDEVLECVNEVMKEADIAVGRYNMKLHQLESKLLFEAADEEQTNAAKQEEGKGVLAKIGNTVLKLVSRISNFLKSFADKITGHIKQGKSDQEKVNQILAEHPDLKDQIVEGINKEWFTVSDVAKFEKDALGLIQMLEKGALDHQTFMDKFKARCQAFADGAKPIVDAGTTVIKFARLFPDLHKAAKDTKDALTDIHQAADDFKSRVEHNYVDKDVNKAHAILNAFGQMTGILTKDARQKAQATSGWRKWANSFCNSAVGKALHMDDQRRTDRHQAADKKRMDRETTQAVRNAAARQEDEARVQAIKNKMPGIIQDKDVPKRK